MPRCRKRSKATLWRGPPSTLAYRAKTEQERRAQILRWHRSTFLRALCAPIPPASPRAALQKACSNGMELAIWMEESDFLVELWLRLRRRFGENRARHMIDVLIRFALSRRLCDACDFNARNHRSFFSDEEELWS